MSYLTLDDGTDAADFDSLYGREWNFIYALEDKIKANTNAGKPPFDGIISRFINYVKMNFEEICMNFLLKTT